MNEKPEASSIITNLNRANELIDSCKKILNENSDLLDNDDSNTGSLFHCQRINSSDLSQSSNSSFEATLLRKSDFGRLRPVKTSSSGNYLIKKNHFARIIIKDFYS